MNILSLNLAQLQCFRTIIMLHSSDKGEGRRYTMCSKVMLSLFPGDIFLLVFSLDDRGSLDEVCELLNEITAAKPKLENLKHPAKIPVVICGNKADLKAQGAVRRSQVKQILGEDVAFFETSAKDCNGLDDAFKALTSLGGLPIEISPSRHQLISINTYQSLCISGRGTGNRLRGHGAPCAAMDLLARRPSFTTDLQLVLTSSTKRNKPERCQIQ